MANHVTLDLVDGVETLVCDCGASAPNNSKEGARFAKRHPSRCSERKAFTKQLAQGTKCVDYDSATGCSDDQLFRGVTRQVVDTVLEDIKDRELAALRRLKAR